jgi:prepilin-type N-terminal cleavage/methylation domain-containing protein
MRNQLFHIDNQGFSLVELLISMTVLLVITGVAVSSLNDGLKRSRLERNLAARDSQVKRAVELISLELAQTGITPDFTNNPDPLVGLGPVINDDLALSTTNITLSSVTGLYPGRPITLTLPEGGIDSEECSITSISGNSITINAGTSKLHMRGDAISSQMLPNIFGLLNPPSGAINGRKTVTRLGIMGDILNNNSLQYIEYSFSNGALYRSITPINGTTIDKATFELLLDNLSSCNFTIVYASPTLPIPVSVVISIVARADVSDEAITGNGPRYRTIAANTEVQLRGMSAASVIWSRNGEGALRSMMPPCSGGPVSGFPPCTSWNTYPWWNNLLNFTNTPDPLP